METVDRQRSLTRYEPRTVGFRHLRSHDCQRAGCFARQAMVEAAAAKKPKRGVSKRRFASAWAIYS